MNKPSTLGGSTWARRQERLLRLVRGRRGEMGAAVCPCQPHGFGRFVVALLTALFGAMNAHALDVGLKGIIGYGVPLTSSLIPPGQNTTVSCAISPCPLNDDGAVAFNLLQINPPGNPGYALLDGKAGLVLNGNLGPANQTSGPLELNNASTLVYLRQPIYAGVPIYSQLFGRASPSSVVTPMSQPNPGPSYWLDVNNTGLGVVLRLSGAAGNTAQVVRLRGDGAEDLLAIDPAFIVISNSKPRVLDSGDIYVYVLNYGNNSHEIWRFASGVVTDHTVVYSLPTGSGAVSAWDVNESGDLAIGMIDSSGVSVLLYVPSLGASGVIGGSAFGGTRAQYSFVGINSAGWVSAFRSKGGGTAIDPLVRELLYARPGGALEPALVKGVPLAYGATLTGLTAELDSLTVNGLPIIDLAPASRMNEYGQLTLNLAVSVPGLLPQYQVVRVDPQGSIGNPVMPDTPDVCLVASGWCFGDSPNSTINKLLRSIYFDPVLAQGYEYVATSNAFTSVRIPFAYGDGRFALYVWDDATGQYVNSGREVIAGELFHFDQLGYASGIARFALLGIEAAAGVDSADPRGFVTGLTFASAGAVRFIMKPVTGALDSDGDGIPDSADACPRTPANTVVNAQGCSVVQLDADGDGVPNSVDVCPNTPAGVVVDVVGCAASQRDTDGDGVVDSLDLCPSTPTNTAVNAAGCSPAQLDSDGDGVSDSVDACPGTPAGTPVDAKGCPIVQQAKVCDVDKNGSIDWRDIKSVLLAVGKPAVGVDDPRDPNRNGKIDLKDAAICTSKCDRMFCLAL